MTIIIMMENQNGVDDDDDTYFFKKIIRRRTLVCSSLKSTKIRFKTYSLMRMACLVVVFIFIFITIKILKNEILHKTTTNLINTFTLLLIY